MKFLVPNYSCLQNLLNELGSVQNQEKIICETGVVGLSTFPETKNYQSLNNRIRIYKQS